MRRPVHCVLSEDGSVRDTTPVVQFVRSAQSAYIRWLASATLHTPLSRQQYPCNAMTHEGYSLDFEIFCFPISHGFVKEVMIVSNALERSYRTFLNEFTNDLFNVNRVGDKSIKNTRSGRK